jgi:hypothetical protein
VVGGSGRDGTVWAAAMAVTDPNGTFGCQFRAWPGLLR